MNKSLAVVLVACAGAAGCDGGVEADPEMIDAAEHRIGRIELPNGNVMEIFEPTPGDLVIGETFTAESDALSARYDLSAMSLAEIHALAAPAVPVPSALIEADRRSAELAADLATAPLEATARRVDTAARNPVELVQPLAVARNVNWFKLNYCNTWHPTDFEYCWTEITNDSTIVVNDVNGTKATVYPYRGSLTFTFQYRTWWSWDTYLSKSLTEGNGWYVTRKNAGVDFDIRSKVTSASGDGYHHAVHGVKSGATAHYYD